jgi:hypothetical protein
MTEQLSAASTAQPFYLIVTDHDRGVFAVEGPMTDDKHWQDAAREARNHQRRITCARPPPIATRWRPRIAAGTSSPAFRPAAS